MKHLLFGVIIALASAVAAAGALPFGADDVALSGLTTEQAKKVLIVVLKHEKYRLSDKGMFIDDNLLPPSGKPDRPGYIDFSLSWDNPKAGATAYLGYYSVNIKTGDVWEVESCIHYRFALLRALQRKIVQRTGTPLTNEDVARSEVGCPATK